MTTSSKTKNPIKDLLMLFRFHHAAESFETQAQEAAAKNLSHLDFLERVLSAEAALRHERTVQLRIREAKIPVIKTIDGFDWAHPAFAPRQLILNAFSMSFVERKENLILVGPSGVGKTHIAQALAYAACQKEMKTLWTTAADIVNTLTAAKADCSVSGYERIPDGLLLLASRKRSRVAFGPSGIMTNQFIISYIQFFTLQTTQREGFRSY